jgi:hypothetical protein
MSERRADDVLREALTQLTMTAVEVRNRNTPSFMKHLAVRIEMARAALASAPRVGEWIPVNERLPEPDADVSCDVRGRLDRGLAEFHREGGRPVWMRAGYAMSEPTHWMPLPAPPGARPAPSSPEAPEGLAKELHDAAMRALRRCWPRPPPMFNYKSATATPDTPLPRCS